MEEQTDILIAKKLTGEATTAELQRLDEWLQEDGNKQHYDNIVAAWKEADDLLGAKHFDKTQAWATIAKHTVDRATIKPARTIAMPLWAKYAAGIAAILLVGLIIMRPATDAGMVTLIADAGNTSVVLPDKSRITLREGSKLVYPENFNGSERNVSLEGEAFFEVTRDTAHPFVVDAQSVSVTVLGTSFDVRCNAREAEVIVATGKVRVENKQVKGSEVLLTPGEYASLKADVLTENTTEGSNYLFWKTGKLSYDNKTLQYIIGDIAQHYHVQIKADSTMAEERKSQLITISFQNQSIETILNELCLIAQCKWQQTDENYVIMAK